MFRIIDLENIKGVGKRLAERILNTYDGYDNFIESMKNYDIDKLLNLNGLSQQKALEIVRYVENEGNISEDFLKTQQAEDIYKDIINRILCFSNTSYATNRIRLLRPSSNIEEINKTHKLISSTLESLRDLDYDYIRSLYSNIKLLSSDVKIRFNDTYAIVCEDYDDYLYLLENNMNKYCNIYSVEDHAKLDEYEFIIYVYNEYNVEPGETANIISVSNNAPLYEIQPKIVIDYYKHNRQILENVYELRNYIGMDSVIDEVLSQLDNLTVDDNNLDGLEEYVEELKTKTDIEIDQRIKNTNLSGEEVLQLMANEGNYPEKIQTIFDEELHNAQDQIKNTYNIDIDPFIVKYPLEIDHDEIQRVCTNSNMTRYLTLYEKEVLACKKLESLKSTVINETIETIHYDYNFTLCCFSKYYDLTMPQIADEYQLNEGLHLNLKSEEKKGNINATPINYWLNEDNNIVLLTGANSGGKTTLLETLAQHSIMAHMGLGVCSKSSTVPLNSQVYYFTKKQSLNAGAFETFLESFIPVTIGEDKKLVLIDELEAITELEASIKIIIGFIEHLKNKQSYTVIVTHMAPEILKKINDINIRIDGIEASGLDDDYNLIVNRTPKIDYLANSTPELILKRIYEKSDEPLKSVYKDILEKF
ncbi:MAG: AAA family ATPase [Methanosphaera sp.]|nr:AAA family ATPase [Methanosphaera sp.]